MSARMHARGRAPRREKREGLREWYSERDGERAVRYRYGSVGVGISSAVERSSVL